MLNRFRQLFKPAPAAYPPDDPASPSSDGPEVVMHWLPNTRQPLADWERIAEAEQPQWSDFKRDAFWTAAAHHWLQAMAKELGPDYRVLSSEHFLLLTSLELAKAQPFLKYCETVRRWVVRNLGPLAHPVGGGKHVCLMFAEDDQYYDYIAHYYPDGGEYALSAGMFVNAGYGHFALCDGDVDTVQPTIAHELTHALLGHLRIPTWLNEGMAVNTEHSLFSRLADPRAALYSPQEIAQKHAAFWTPEHIQEFWSGAAFHRTDDGNLLSYDLAKKIVGLAAREHDAFVAFVLSADRDDGGQAAAEHLGYPVHHLVEAVLGEGQWAPDPRLWSSTPVTPRLQN